MIDYSFPYTFDKGGGGQKIHKANKSKQSIGMSNEANNHLFLKSGIDKNNDFSIARTSRDKYYIYIFLQIMQ